ncbi:S9 family peptidase [Bacillus sp. FSL W7-1360]
MQFSKPSVEQFFEVFNLTCFAVDPEEKQLIFEIDFAGKPEIWAMDLDTRFPYKLHASGQQTHDLRYSKDGSYIVVSFDHDGDENAQVYALPREGGEVKPLICAEGERHMVEGFSKDGQSLYYTTTNGNKMYLNVMRYDVEKGIAELIHEGEGTGTYLAGKSDDERTLVIGKHFANTYIPVYVLRDGTLTPIVTDGNEVYSTSAGEFMSENDLYMAINHESDFHYLSHYDVENNKLTKVHAFTNESINGLYGSADKKGLYISTSAGVDDRLYYYDIATNTCEPMSLPVNVITQFVVSKKGTLFLLGQTATSPNNLYRYDGNAWEKLTTVQVPGIAEETLVEPELLRYPSFDGLEIEALYFRPRPEVDNGHVILWPHGGPQAAERKTYRAWFHYLVYAGYRIVAPNFRGSTEYGAAFMKMVQGDWGHGPRLDNIACLDYLIENGYVESDKIFLMGGSYGGYMALLLHGRHASYFKGVVDIFGVSNLLSFYKSAPDHWKPMLKTWIGDPEKDHDRFVRDSPITYLEDMTKPMLVIQGANDPRVVKSESDRVVEALREKGREVEYIVFDDEGHGFTKKENRIVTFKRILAFFDQYL